MSSPWNLLSMELRHEYQKHRLCLPPAERKDVVKAGSMPGIQDLILPRCSGFDISTVKHYLLYILHCRHLTYHAFWARVFQ